MCVITICFVPSRSLQDAIFAPAHPYSTAPNYSRIHFACCDVALLLRMGAIYSAVCLRFHYKQEAVSSFRVLESRTCLLMPILLLTTAVGTGAEQVGWNGCQRDCCLSSARRAYHALQTCSLFVARHLNATCVRHFDHSRNCIRKFDHLCRH